MKTSQVLLAIAAAFVGGSALGYLAAHFCGSKENQARQGAVYALRSEISELQDVNRRLKDKLVLLPVNRPSATEEASKTAGRAGGLTHIEKLRALAELKERKLVTPILMFLDRKGKIDSSILGLFETTPYEQERLQQAVVDVREKLANLERANAKVSRDEKGNVVVAVQPFPADGGRLYDTAMQAFSAVLGPERYDAFRAIAAEQFEKSLGGFGVAEHTYTFGHGETGYTFTDKVTQRNEKGEVVGISTNNTGFPSFDALGARVGPIVSILPPEYIRGK